MSNMHTQAVSEYPLQHQTRAAYDPHLTVYLVQRGQNIFYKSALRRLFRCSLLELAGGGLEVDVAPKAAGKLLGVHGGTIHITVQLGKGQQGE